MEIRSEVTLSKLEFYPLRKLVSYLLDGVICNDAVEGKVKAPWLYSSCPGGSSATVASSRSSMYLNLSTVGVLPLPLLHVLRMG